jgi:hypothetical protein
MFFEVETLAAKSSCCLSTFICVQITVILDVVQTGLLKICCRFGGDYSHYYLGCLKLEEEISSSTSIGLCDD